VDHSTSTDSYLGTPLYSSPEQLRGVEVTAKSDVYSLGATLYHAAVGEPPFSGSWLEVASQQVVKPPVSPRERGAYIGERLEALILGCLAKHPDDRPDAAALHERLLQMNAAVTGTTSGVVRATGAAKAAGAAGVKAVRRGLGRRRAPDLPGPPEITISVPTRTFRAGSRQRRTLAASMVALLLFFIIAAGSWALFGSETGKQTTGPLARLVEPRLSAPNPPAVQRTGNTATGNEPVEEPAGEPALPPAQAEQAVFDMYVQESYQTPETSWVYLSDRLQNEVGSPEQWAVREQIYDLYWVQFTQMPQATVSGDKAEVTFEVRLDRTGGSELLSGTWVCVVEDGEWKLDRLENERTQPL
jgi:serine/threonine-protein kinase